MAAIQTVAVIGAGDYPESNAAAAVAHGGMEKSAGGNKT
jgi:hypothetical protein